MIIITCIWSIILIFLAKELILIIPVHLKDLLCILMESQFSLFKLIDGLKSVRLLEKHVIYLILTILKNTSATKNGLKQFPVKDLIIFHRN